MSRSACATTPRSASAVCRVACRSASRSRTRAAVERGLGDGDLLRPASLAQVGELGLGPVARGLGLGERDLGVGTLLAGDDMPGGHPVALARPDLDERQPP